MSALTEAEALKAKCLPSKTSLQQQVSLNSDTCLLIITNMRHKLLVVTFFIFTAVFSAAQKRDTANAPQNFIGDRLFSGAIKTYPQIAEGIPIRSIVIILHKEGKRILADSTETAAFEQAFGLKPGASFKQYFADLAIKRIVDQPDIGNANYELYNNEISGPVTLLVNVFFLRPGESKVVAGIKGMQATKSLRGFPIIKETDHSKFMLVFNGGIGQFNEVNALFGQGKAFTQGNSIATDPAQPGVRYWGEAYLEPGIAGIARLGKSKMYAYGSGTVLISGRNSSDIYSAGPTVYANFERLYGGILGASLGKNKNTNFDLSYGRQFFQLNDGFLFSKFSGSSNAGERGSVYLNSRTAFQKSFLGKLNHKKWTLQAFWLEPQELFKASQQNTSYAGGGLTYNNNKTIDAGLYYIQTVGGTATYRTVNGHFAKKGMYVINPKLWLTNIAQTGLFFKSELAFQNHVNANMKSLGFYLGGGISKKDWKYKPSLQYRYAFMQGDDSLTQRYEKFDPMLTGGLGNWVQGINFRKVSGNGNIGSHRIELKAFFTKTFEASFDYFMLLAPSMENTGALAPLAKLKGRQYGQEFTFSTRYFLSNHFMLLGILSHALPGNATRNAFATPTRPWTSVQLALFMFY
jgi:hypothetical protein